MMCDWLMTHRARTLLAVSAMVLGLATAAAEQPPPDGFEVVPYATGLVEPVALAFAPDGRLFVTEKAGKIRIVQDGVLQPEPFASVDVYTVNENGLLGIAIDPDFAQNHYVFVFASISQRQQHVIRFTEVDGVGADPFVVRDALPGSESVHSGGGLQFGPDGKLYFSIGDTGERALAQDLKSLAGKIMRINPDGSTPSDNPFTTPTGSPRAVYAIGFRNPFRFAFAPDGRMFVMDVGSDEGPRREEVNIIRAGDNAGWPLVEGKQSVRLFPDFVDPIIAYHEEGQAITGGVVYTGSQFPKKYRGNLFHLEFVLNRVFRVEVDGDALIRHELFYETTEAGPVDIVQAPDGSLVYSEIFTGRLMRIRYTKPLESDPIQPRDPNVPAEPNNPMMVQPPRCGFGLAPVALMTWFSLAFTRRSRHGRAHP